MMIDDHLQAASLSEFRFHLSVHRSPVGFSPRPLGTEHAPGRLVSDGRRFQHGADGRRQDRCLGECLGVRRVAVEYIGEWLAVGGNSPSWLMESVVDVCDFRCWDMHFI